MLSCIGKLFTKIINNRLYEWADNYNVFIEAQAGFRKGMSTVDNVFILHGLITHMVNQGKKLYCTFIDFTKAFDYVVRDNLWYKLIKLGLRGNIMNIIKSMYSCVKSRVRYEISLAKNSHVCLELDKESVYLPFFFQCF